MSIPRAGGPTYGLAIAVLLLSASRAEAGGGTVAAGVAVLSVGSDQLASSGVVAGPQVTIGYRWDHFGFALDVAGSDTQQPTRPTTEIYYPADEAGYAVVSFALRWDLLALSQHRVAPWVQVGAGISMLQWKTFFYSQSGTGPVLSAGADCRIVDGLFARAAVAWTSASTHDNYDHRTPALDATMLLVGVGWQFGLPDLPR